MLVGTVWQVLLGTVWQVLLGTVRQVLVLAECLTPGLVVCPA